MPFPSRPPPSSTFFLSTLSGICSWSQYIAFDGWSYLFWLSFHLNGYTIIVITIFESQ